MKERTEGFEKVAATDDAQQLTPASPIGMAVGADIPPSRPPPVPAIRVWTDMVAVSTWRRRPRVGTIRGGGAEGACGQESVACSQVSQWGLWVRPAKGVGSRVRFGLGDGGAGVVGHAVQSLRHTQWSMQPATPGRSAPTGRARRERSSPSTSSPRRSPGRGTTDRTTVIVIETDPHEWTEGGAWWEVGVPATSERPSIQQARHALDEAKSLQRRGV